MNIHIISILFKIHEEKLFSTSSDFCHQRNAKDLPRFKQIFQMYMIRNLCQYHPPFLENRNDLLPKLYRDIKDCPPPLHTHIHCAGFTFLSDAKIGKKLKTSKSVETI